jgi:hypothetical protein
MLRIVWAAALFGVVLHSLVMAATPTGNAIDVAVPSSVHFRLLKDIAYQSAEPKELADIYLPLNASAMTGLTPACTRV